MERFEGYIFTALCSINFLISCLLFSKITREQREPYMDEIFHVPQAQKFCEGKFNQVRYFCTLSSSDYLTASWFMWREKEKVRCCSDGSLHLKVCWKQPSQTEEVSVVVFFTAQWDPMITTLPGLYLLSVGLIKPVVWLAGLTGKVVCSAGMLRFINTIFNCGNLYLLYLIVCKLHLRDKVGYMFCFLCLGVLILNPPFIRVFGVDGL